MKKLIYVIMILSIISILAAVFEIFINLNFKYVHGLPIVNGISLRPHIVTQSSKLAENMQDGKLELPINGATGYASIRLDLYKTPRPSAEIISEISVGQPFIILREVESWWEIEIGEKTGWVLHNYCFINLPDIIPSIVYKNTNAYSSLFRSSQKDIPNVTGRLLYNAFGYNQRLRKEEFIVPVLYAMALKIRSAQRAALAQGNTLVIYEAYRPYAVQKEIVRNLTLLIKKMPSILKGMNKTPWSMGWFISTGVSNHQRGYAIDVSLGKITSLTASMTGSFFYPKIAAYEEYTMPTEMHELSAAAVAFVEPVAPKSRTAWKNGKPSQDMNRGALLLQKYCTDAGMTPMASEWWHFNDLDCEFSLGENKSSGKYNIDVTLSRVPQY